METNNTRKYVVEANLIEQEIKDGKFGLAGERFLSTRELAKVRDVSLVTAQRILVKLRGRNIIELYGKKYYLTHGRIPSKSPLGKLRNNDSKLLGLHITNLESQFFASLARAVEVCAQAEGYRVLIASSLYKYEEEKNILNTFRRIGVSGVLSCPGTSENTNSLYGNYMLPHVFLGRKPQGANAEGVLVHDYPVARNIASHLISKGFKKFAYIGLEELYRGLDSRLAGFAEGLLREGYELKEANIIRAKADSMKTISRSLENFLRGLQEPTGIFCFHDLLAVEVLKSCRKLKISIPEMVAVAGFDDLPIASNTTPPLTTVRYRVREMAQTAVQLLINQIKTEKENNTNYYIEPSLIIRGSTSNIKIKAQESIEIHDILYKISI